jgi:tol-pal system protein YbgF
VPENIAPAKNIMMRRAKRTRSAVLVALPALLLAGAAMAQERSGNFLDNLFNRGGDQPAQQQRQAQPRGAAQADPSDPGDLSVRLDRLENAMRQFTGTLEQLQYQNQQLQTQLKRMQDDQLGPKGAAPPPAAPGRRSDVFDPAQQPNAPGAPRTLGNSGMAAGPPPIAAGEAPVGAPGGRAAGAPLDLATLAGNAGAPPPPPNLSAPSPMPPGPASPARIANVAPMPPPQQPPVQQMPPRNAGPSAGPSGGGAQVATLPPSASPQDEYDMAYGYMLHKDYALAEQAFRDFLGKHPNERLVPDAQYWLGESLFQRQRYRDAAESFLAVSTKFEGAGKAPDSLLRLGQSLAALNQKEAACATLAEVGRKYPRASASVKRGVTQEQTRVHC